MMGPCERVSVVIPTFNRTEELREALESILAQTVRPVEVIVVDDSTDDRVEKVVRGFLEEFGRVHVMLMYFRNPRGRSAASARNFGGERATGDILLFLDDDVVLEPGYLQALVAVYQEHTDAVAVQGFHGAVPEMTFFAKLTNAFDKAFFLFAYVKDACDLMPSFNQTYPHTLTKVVRCQWMSGCNQSYRREVFLATKYDESLKRYSIGEDIDLSYRVHRLGKGAMYITPHAKLVHKYSEAARIPSRSYMFVHSAYMQRHFRRNIEQSARNRLIYWWSRVGRVVSLALRRLRARLEGDGEIQVIELLRDSLQAELAAWRNRDRIAAGDLSYLEPYLKY